MNIVRCDLSLITNCFEEMSMNNKNNNGFLRNAFLYIIVIIAVVTGVQYFAGGSQSPSQQLSYTQLVKKIEDGKVKIYHLSARR